jgi:uroporphyrin-III C-methyltransferase
MARRDAERIFVGKARANHCMPQAEINALLVRLARQGRRVVRLKGGDPFVFGRGGEEAAALAEAGIHHEVVPGVTAALACAAESGIPLTHRDAARALTLVTGHTREGRLDLDFAALARPGQTIAVYMGASTLPELAAGLIAAGLDPSTPAAMVENGGTGSSRRLDDTLGGLPGAAAGWASGGPALILVGEVVGLAPASRGSRAAVGEGARTPRREGRDAGVASRTGRGEVHGSAGTATRTGGRDPAAPTPSPGLTQRRAQAPGPDRAAGPRDVREAGAHGGQGGVPAAPARQPAA